MPPEILAMLLGLTRFLTTEEVRQEYRVPPSLAPELLAELPAVADNADGQRIHLECEVDDFFAEFFRRRRLAISQSGPRTHVRAGRHVETQEVALYADELRRQKRTWKQIWKACKERWPGDPRVRTFEQIRATHRRHLGGLRKKTD